MGDSDSRDASGAVSCFNIYICICFIKHVINMKRKLISSIITALVLLVSIPTTVSAQGDFEKGVQAFENKDYSTALKYFLPYNDISSRVNSALCYYNLEDYDNAIKMAIKADIHEPDVLRLIADSWYLKSDSDQSFIPTLNAAKWCAIAWFNGVYDDRASLAISRLINYKNSDGTANDFNIKTAKVIAIEALQKNPNDIRVNQYMGLLYYGYEKGEDELTNLDNAKYWFKRAFSLAEKKEREGDNSYDFVKSFSKGIIENLLTDASEARATVRVDNLSQIAAGIPKYTCNGTRIVKVTQDSYFKEDCAVFQTNANVTGAKGKLVFATLHLFDENGEWITSNIESVFDSYTPSYDNAIFGSFQQGIYPKNMLLSDGRHKVYMVLEATCGGATIGYSDIREVYITLSNGRITSLVPTGGAIRGNYL